MLALNAMHNDYWGISYCAVHPGFMPVFRLSNCSSPSFPLRDCRLDGSTLYSLDFPLPF